MDKVVPFPEPEITFPQSSEADKALFSKGFRLLYYS
jgi:hypothetical protein